MEEKPRVRGLHKSLEDRELAGVCGGLAEYAGLESDTVRLIFILGWFIGGGVTIPLYIILMLAMPKHPDWDRVKAREQGQQDTTETDVPKKAKRKNDDDMIHIARPIREDESAGGKAKRSSDETAFE